MINSVVVRKASFISVSLFCGALLLVSFTTHAAPLSDVFGHWSRRINKTLTENHGLISLTPQFFQSSTIVRSKNSKNYVAFTFDDGPNYKTTPSVLKTLKRFHVPATFFVVGQRFTGKKRGARLGKKILMDIVKDGHEIGNHTFSHKNLRKINRTLMTAEVSKGRSRITDELGMESFLFRPPYGATSPKVHRQLKANDDVEVMWNIDSKDYRRALKGSLARRVLKSILSKKGGIVLFHDTKSWTADALPALLSKLEKENCKLLNLGKPPILPVSLHYFTMDDQKEPMPIPEVIKYRTNQYTTFLQSKCKDE